MFGLLGYDPLCDDGEDVYAWRSLQSSLEKLTFKKSSRRSRFCGLSNS